MLQQFKIGTAWRKPVIAIQRREEITEWANENDCFYWQ